MSCRLLCACFACCVLLLRSEPSTLTSYQYRYNAYNGTTTTAKCNATNYLPMWSRGFASTCCDVFPEVIGAQNRHINFFEHGDLSNENYFEKRHIKHKDIVYVATADMPFFMPKFLELSQDTRIVLVTGSEDIGSPYELFHPDRKNFFDYKMSALWPKGQKISMVEFLQDQRLHKWFVQNYDAVGCNAYSCSTLDRIKDQVILDKIVPIPIGLDFHSSAEPKRLLERTCEQRIDLDSLKSGMLPFGERKEGVVAAFDCKFDRTRIGIARHRTRGEICALLSNSSATRSLAVVRGAGGKEGLDRRLTFWRHLSQYKYSLAPAGFGLDTHRLWEILQMGSVPITVSSSLDSLYSQFPIVILDKWADLVDAKVFKNHLDKIIKSYGADPVNTYVQHKLSMLYWIDVVRAQKEMIM